MDTSQPNHQGVMSTHNTHQDEQWFLPSEEYLLVAVLSASGLPYMDYVEVFQPDPYVRISFGEQVARTVTKESTVSPSWNQLFQFHLNTPSASDMPEPEPVKFEIFDNEMYSRDDHIGDAFLKCEDCDGNEKELPVYSKNSPSLHNFRCGSIKILASKCQIVHPEFKQGIEINLAPFQEHLRHALGTQFMGDERIKLNGDHNSRWAQDLVHKNSIFVRASASDATSEAVCSDDRFRTPQNEARVLTLPTLTSATDVEEHLEKSAQELDSAVIPIAPWIIAQIHNKSEAEAWFQPSEEYLLLAVFSASELPHMDFFGLCLPNPYVKIYVGDEVTQTATMFRTRSPVWDQLFQFHLEIPTASDTSQLVKMEVYDHDVCGRDEPIGVAFLKFEDLDRDKKRTPAIQSNILSSTVQARLHQNSCC